MGTYYDLYLIRKPHFVNRSPDFRNFIFPNHYTIPMDVISDAYILLQIVDESRRP